MFCSSQNCAGRSLRPAEARNGFRIVAGSAGRGPRTDQGSNLNITFINSIEDLLFISFSNSSSVKYESPTRATNSTKKRR